MSKKEEREEMVFKCLSCKRHFTKKITKSEIGMVSCPASCTNSKVEEITTGWFKKRELRRKQRDSRTADRLPEEKQKNILKTEFPRT